MPHPVERFWSHVHVGEPDECWPWSAATRKGYGSMKLAAGDLGVLKRSDVYAHRISFYIEHGRWPDPVARHTCDNPICCNPRHLIDGTVLQNNHDMIDRGRYWQPAGVDNHNSRLTHAQVEEIRSLRASGLAQRVIGDRFGISQASVSRILAGKRYR